MTRIMQDGLVATAEVQALLAVDAGTTILVSKKSPPNRLESANISHLAKRTIKRYKTGVAFAAPVLHTTLKRGVAGF